MPLGGCGSAHIGSLCISVIILVIVIILIVMVVYNYNSTNNTTTTTQQRPQINNRAAALAAAGMYKRRNNGGAGAASGAAAGFRNRNRNNKNGFATANCNNSTVGCWYAQGALSTVLKKIESTNNGYIPMNIVNSLKNFRTSKGGVLSPRQMQTSHWPPMTAKGLPANGVAGNYNNCATRPCYATSKCNNSSVACFYAQGALPVVLRNFEATHNGMITRKLANSLQNIRTSKGGGLSAKAMQRSRWSASA